MKKLLLAAPLMLALTFAYAGDKKEDKAPGRDNRPQISAEMKKKMEEKKAEREQNKKEMDEFKARYAKAKNDKDKKAVRDELLAKVTKKSEERRAERRERLNEMKANVKKMEDAMDKQDKEAPKFNEGLTDAILAGTEKEYMQNYAKEHGWEKPNFKGEGPKDFKGPKGDKDSKDVKGKKDDKKNK